MPLPSIPQERFEIVTVQPDGSIQLQSAPETILALVAEFAVTEPVTRGAGDLDPIACQPVSGSLPLRGWVVDWSRAEAKRQPDSKALYDVKLWERVTTTVTRNGTMDTLPDVGGRVVDLDGALLEITRIVAGVEPGTVTTQYERGEHWRYAPEGNAFRIEWLVDPKPDTTRTTAMIPTSELSMNPPTHIYRRWVDWDIRDGDVAWISDNRPSAGTHLSAYQTEAMTYPVALIVEKTKTPTRGTNPDPLPVTDLDRIVTLLGTTTFDYKEVDGVLVKTPNLVSTGYQPDLDGRVYATQVVPPAVAPGTAYQFTGRARKPLKPEEYVVEGNVIRPAGNVPFEVGSEVWVHYRYAGQPVLSFE